MLRTVLIFGFLIIGGYFVYTKVIIPGGGIENILKNLNPVPKSSTTPPFIKPPPSVPATVTSSSAITNPQYGSLEFGNEKKVFHSWRQNSMNVSGKITTMSCSITIRKDNGNNIPAGGDQLYLFIYFGKRVTPGEGELDIKCLSTGQVAFVAVYQGTVRNTFRMPVAIGHTYQRTMTLKNNKMLIFTLKDSNTGQIETFNLNVNAEAPRQIAVGIEYHNPVAKTSFPDRFEVQTSTPTFK